MSAVDYQQFNTHYWSAKKLRYILCILSLIAACITVLVILFYMDLVCNIISGIKIFVNINNYDALR